MRAASPNIFFIVVVALLVSALNGCGRAQAVQADSSAARSARFSVPMDDTEVLAPLSSWADAKKDFGAKGDGVADDTVALQKALDALGHPGQANILYLPVGTYRITSTLHWNGTFRGPTGTTLIGEAPGSTSIVWDGPKGGTMLVQNGGIFFRYARLTWDGQSKAGIGVAQMWNMHSDTVFGGNTEHEDEVFEDMGIGIMAGRLGKDYGNLDSEGVIRRVTFLRDTTTLNASGCMRVTRRPAALIALGMLVSMGQNFNAGGRRAPGRTPPRR